MQTLKHLSVVLLFISITFSLYAVPNEISYQGFVQVDGQNYDGAGAFRAASRDYAR